MDLAPRRGKIGAAHGFFASPWLCCAMIGPANQGRSRRRRPLLNRTDRQSPMPGEAEVKYLDGDFRIVRPGAFVRCAVTGVAIPLEELRYWSVDLQEAYATPEAVLQQHAADYARKS
jgi:hypothetical protein